MKIKQIQSLNVDKTKIVVVTADRFVVYDTVKQEIVKELKNKKKESAPELVDLSNDDKYAIEVQHASPTTVFLRNLITSTVVAKFEGHS